MSVGCASNQPRPPLPGVFADDEQYAAVVHQFGSFFPLIRTPLDNDHMVVHLTAVDGGGVISKKWKQYWISPGKHTLEVTCFSKAYSGSGKATIEVNLAQGKKYQLDANHKTKWQAFKGMVFDCSPFIAER